MSTVPRVDTKRMTDEQYGRLVEDVIGLYFEGDLTWPECKEQLLALHDRFTKLRGLSLGS